MSAELLNSWKEIAAYVGRGVRTVQRWEVELELPVRRMGGKYRTSVSALKSEIDLWIRMPRRGTGQDHHGINFEIRRRMRRNRELLHARTASLLTRYETLKKQITRTVVITSTLKAACKK